MNTVGISRAVTAINWALCASQVAATVLQYGIPIAKVISWLKKARALWGGLRGIYYAIASGSAAAEIGEDAVSIIEGILGLDAVKKACFS